VWVREPGSAVSRSVVPLASSTLIILFSEMLTFSKNICFPEKNKIPKENKESDEIFENISLVD
jgi:hypothetical protein